MHACANLKKTLEIQDIGSKLSRKIPSEQKNGTHKNLRFQNRTISEQDITFHIFCQSIRMKLMLRKHIFN